MQPSVGVMNGRQRVLAALGRQAVDRAPVCNPTSVATVELMDLVDAPFPESCREPELIARLAATGYTCLLYTSLSRGSRFCDRWRRAVSKHSRVWLCDD